MFRLFLLLPVVAGLRIERPATVSEAVQSVIQRLPSWVSEEFSISDIDDKLELLDDVVQVTVREDNQKIIKATSPTAALYGINWFLREHCYTQITWDNSSFGNGCATVEPQTITLEAPRVRYFGNPCTYSYSFVWWRWQDWEKMIDWLALNGFNMVLAPLGQEAIWRETFLSLGVSRNDLMSYFTGPAYLAWHRMGNLKAWGGPLSDEFMDQQLELNKKIVERMNQLGIVPVLPTFSGFVPDSMLRVYPEAKFVQNSCWNGFNASHSCIYSVHHKEKLFFDVAKIFHSMQKNVYGIASHVYSADIWNELSRTENIRGLRDSAHAVHKACINSDEQCIWLLQSWTFSYDGWSTKSVKAFLSGVPIGHLLVLDLYAEKRPMWRELNSFYGHSFVWCMLHNFGGSTELRGNIKHLNKAYQLAFDAPSTMVGAGLSMEAIHQNYIVYQFMIDRMWTPTPVNLNHWLRSYVFSRYQVESTGILKIWSHLMNTFYAEPVNKMETQRFSVFLYDRPAFGQRIRYWFQRKPVEEAIVSLLQFQTSGPASGSELLRMDTNDLLREQMQYDLGNKVILRIYESYGISENMLIERNCQDMTVLFTEIEKYANYNLEDWEDAAKSWGSSAVEKQQFAENARDLLTTWGPHGQNIDYAHREWAGLISRYYLPRWNFFCDWIQQAEIFNKQSFDNATFHYIEQDFVVS